ncbi:MAG: hypothetical protein WCT24_01940 [Patescibacteria group bacterium]|jgi:hypothetical protein
MSPEQITREPRETIDRVGLEKFLQLYKPSLRILSELERRLHLEEGDPLRPSPSDLEDLFKKTRRNFTQPESSEGFLQQAGIHDVESARAYEELLKRIFAKDGDDHFFEHPLREHFYVSLWRTVSRNMRLDDSEFSHLSDREQAIFEDQIDSYINNFMANDLTQSFKHADSPEEIQQSEFWKFLDAVGLQKYQGKILEIAALHKTKPFIGPPTSEAIRGKSSTGDTEEGV